MREIIDLFPLEAKKEQVEKRAQAKQKRNKSDKNKMRNFANFATFARANLGKRHSDIATRKNYCSTKTINRKNN